MSVNNFVFHYKSKKHTLMLTTFLMDIKDFRRPQAQKYKVHDVLLFSILALLCNAKSYRDPHRFMLVHFTELKRDFSLLWKKPPAYTTIRNIIKGVDGLELEAAFRAYTQSLVNYSKQIGLLQKLFKLHLANCQFLFVAAEAFLSVLF